MPRITIVKADKVRVTRPRHACRSAGPMPMRILGIYAAANMTRILADSGKTVELLSAEDLMGPHAGK